MYASLQRLIHNAMKSKCIFTSPYAGFRFHNAIHPLCVKPPRLRISRLYGHVVSLILPYLCEFCHIKRHVSKKAKTSLKQTHYQSGISISASSNRNPDIRERLSRFPVHGRQCLRLFLQPPAHHRNQLGDIQRFRQVLIHACLAAGGDILRKGIR